MAKPKIITKRAEMFKSELRTGDVVILRDGSKMVVLLDCVETEKRKDFLSGLEENTCNFLSGYDDHLKDTGGYTNLDVVKIIKLTHPAHFYKQLIADATIGGRK